MNMSLIQYSVFYLFIISLYESSNACSSVSYHLQTELVTYDEAVQLCHNRSMTLVSIENEEKNEEIFKLLQEKGVTASIWSSGNKKNGKWIWINGEEAKYFSWNNGEPNSFGGNENCIEVFKTNNDVKWNDLACTTKRGYICECETALTGVSVGGKTCSISQTAPSKPTKKFYLSREKVKYEEALQRCSEQYMQLARLTDKKENTALYNWIHEKGATSRFWVAGSKQPGQSWKWSNGDAIKYFNWRRGEPNETKNIPVCLEVGITNNNVEWNDLWCSNERHFVCEKVNPVVKITINGEVTLPTGSAASQGEENCSAFVELI